VHIDTSDQDRLFVDFDEAPHLLAPSVRQGSITEFKALQVAAHVNCKTTTSDCFSVLAEKVIVVQFADAKRVEPGFGDKDDVK